jgi:hypothetical protein
MKDESYERIVQKKVGVNPNLKSVIFVWNSSKCAREIKDGKKK